VPLLVAIVTALAFSRSLGHGFVTWDDERLLLDNSGYRGLGWAQLRWMLGSVVLGHYVPVTWLSFALDYVVWGLRPLGYHLTNVLLHAINAGLVCALASRLLARATAWPAGACRAGAVAAALLWALHPLRVEAVSWVTGRRDVLSACFLCIALGAWLRAAGGSGSGRRRWLWAAVVAYALALGSKAVVMAAPVALVALDVYPLGRLPAVVRRWGSGTLRGVWLEKVPFVVLALLGAVVSSVAVARGIGYEVLSLNDWLGKLAVGLALPAWKTLVPLALSPLYELPRGIDLTAFRYWASGLLVVVATALVVGFRRRWPGGPVAWVWYMAFLAPVSAIAHAGPQLAADRYSYLPALALLVPAGAVVGAAAAAIQAGRRPTPIDRAVVLGVLALLVAFVALTWQQQAIWRDTTSLWAHAVAVTPDCPACQVNAGHMLLEAGQPGAALEHFERAVALRPERAGSYRSVGLALEALGRRDEAIAWYRRGLGAAPGSLAVRLQLATALLAAGQLDEVVETMEAAWRIYEPSALLPYFEAAVHHRPEAPVPRLALVRAWRALGERERARAELEVLRRLHPSLAGLVVAAGDPP
jgi:tetratricopeptide (TPR) repeat protein